ncbi:MAG TPA: DUF1573 domain-containing protein [Candidatus Nealsonbacteria bacterium]|uniref:DUF1573 domain-containing protein n=1 Tax=marine sediment metagenome TaxID=412755 RepID=A0A0F9V175_9ZZZZ|nr:DUF1573 domain-containing protein [Candidatus Nealsonbacteria bacterium]HEB46406.1 DUF1573 domain-containing protein [Candidatus Nealsonbacteria bacterium]
MRLKIWFFSILGLLILGMAVYGYFQAISGPENGAENAPKIEITPEFFDFGEIEYGKVVEYIFKVKNTGKEILEIKRVATSCACTVAKISKEKISPNEEVELLVTYDTGAMSGPHGRGKQERIIYVKSSDFINPQVEVKIYANVR